MHVRRERGLGSRRNQGMRDTRRPVPLWRLSDQHEPGCAVRETVDGDRLRNYHKLLRELRRDTLTPLDRQKQLARWKVRGRAMKERMKQKRGLLGSISSARAFGASSISSSSPGKRDDLAAAKMVAYLTAHRVH